MSGKEERHESSSREEIVEFGEAYADWVVDQLGVRVATALSGVDPNGPLPLVNPMVEISARVNYGVLDD